MFGEVVHAHRRRLGLTQEDLADRSGVSVRTIGKLESGRITSPRPSTVRALADAFDLPDADRRRFYESAAPPPPQPVATVDRPVPAQLPPGVAGFVGRGEHLAALDALLSASRTDGTSDGTSDGAPTAVVISAVSGTAGVGKTALAVHWAHSVVGRFPDGQLYVNLRGFDPDERAMAPVEALRGFLDALGVPAERRPAGLDAMVSLYRSLLAGRRVLVVLDNARDVEQVRPLLPTTASAMAVVTSRHQLTGLVARDAAHPVLLDVLSAGEARELLVQRLGAERVDAEPAAVDDLTTACARLPLALAITAARARHTRFPLAALAAELHEAGHRLDLLDDGDPAGQVRAVLSWSYHTLGKPAARLFRLFGLHPGPDLSLAAAASLGGLTGADARGLLAELVRATMLIEHRPGRYTSHDLLREYAGELTAAHDSDTDRAAATVRLLDHYLHTAYAADRLLHEARQPIELPLAPLAPGTLLERPADYRAAVAWLDTEHPNLLAAVAYGARSGHDGRCWQLAWALETFQVRQGRHREHMASWQTALPAAERLGDAGARAGAHMGIGAGAVECELHDVAQFHLEQALELYTLAGHGEEMAKVHHNLSHLNEGRGRFEQALSHMWHAHSLYERVDDRRGRARALGSIAWIHVRTGENARAIAVGEQAIAIGTSIDDRVAVMYTQDTIGCAHRHLGNLVPALAYHRQALATARELAHRRAEGLALHHLGDTHLAGGDPDAARAAWAESVRILQESNHPDAAQVRAKLDRLPRRDG